MEYEEITHKIIGAAYKVFNTLGFGFLETIYKKAMIIELGKSNFKVEAEKPLKVYFDNQVVGDFYIDLYIEDKVIVELKAVENLAKQHEVQLVNYLNGLKKEIGLLINFGPAGVEVKRKFRKPMIGQDSQDSQDIFFYFQFPEETENTQSPSANTNHDFKYRKILLSCIRNFSKVN